MIEPTARFLHGMEKDGQTPETRTLILMHELGGIANRISKARRIPEDAKLYMADISIDIGQAMLQLEMLSLDLGLSPENCHKAGLVTTWQHFKEFWPTVTRCHKCGEEATPIYASGDKEGSPSGWTCDCCDVSGLSSERNKWQEPDVIQRLGFYNPAFSAMEPEKCTK